MSVICVSTKGCYRIKMICASAARAIPPKRKPAMKLQYLHTMVRVSDIDASMHFYRDLLGLEEVRRRDVPAAKFTLIFLAPPGQTEAQLELTHNWEGDEVYGEGRNFGHLAYRVEDIYATCAKFQAAGVTINRPPRDGNMAFVRSPDGVSVELLQIGDPLPAAEPWASMPNTGHW
jgi:lactoylglutathione lyase